MSAEEPSKPPVIVVTGPTASGKGGLGVALARRLSVPILSLDSMKIYRGMDIGTAKPSARLRNEIPFHLVDIRDPWEAFSVAEYVDEVRRLEPALPAPRLFVGGTAFYLNVLRTGIFAGPGPQPEVRERLTAEAREGGVEALHRRLSDVDPVAASRLHPGDLRRIIRALEVVETSGRPFSELQKERRPVYAEDQVRLIALARPRQELYARIDARVTRMFEAGWVLEVEGLLARHDPPWGAEAAQSIGYTRIRKALEAGEDPAGCREEIQQRTRHFARAQLTWFRRMPLEWWHPRDEESLLDDVERSLGDYARDGGFRPGSRPAPPGT